MKMRRLFALGILASPVCAVAHTEAHFSLMDVERTIEVSTATVQLTYECRLTSSIPEAVLPMVDLNMNGDLETSETDLLWHSAADYLEEDLILYAGRDQIFGQKVEHSVAPDGRSCTIRARISLPESADDLAITVIDPAFLTPPVTGNTLFPPTRGVALPPALLVVDGQTTDTVILETSPAAVLVVRQAP